MESYWSTSDPSDIEISKDLLVTLSETNFVYRIDQDVGLGRACGFQTLLVLTNIPKDKMLTHPTTKPDYYAPSLGSLVHLLS